MTLLCLTYLSIDYAIIEAPTKAVVPMILAPTNFFEVFSVPIVYNPITIASITNIVIIEFGIPNVFPFIVSPYIICINPVL